MGAVEHLPQLDDPARLAPAQIDERIAAGPVNPGDAQDVRFDPARRWCQTNCSGRPWLWQLRAMSNPFKYFNSSPEVIRLVVMMYVRYPLSLRNVEDLLAERGIDISHETIRFWWNRFGPMFAAEIRKRRVTHVRGSQSGVGIWMRPS